MAVKILKESKRINRSPIEVVISDRNKFDSEGRSLDRFNSTETDIYINGEKISQQRIGGDTFRKPEYIGVSFPGAMDDLGFISIVRNISDRGLRNTMKNIKRYYPELANIE